MLAKLHRSGELTAVWVPDAAHEAMRDLVRARATAMRVLGCRAAIRVTVRIAACSDVPDRAIVASSILLPRSLSR